MGARARAAQSESDARHGRLQLRFGIALDAWSAGRGEVATEWRFRIAVPGEPRRPLVPDVAFVACDRMLDLTHDELQAPAFAPTVAVEVLSPGDDPADVASKIDAYLRAGSELAIVVDPRARTITLHDGTTSEVLYEADELRHRALPGFSLQVGTYFAGALDLQR